jgi:hypothetical protein
MIEADLVKKHGRKALGMPEHAHHALSWRQRVPEILLEIGIIVFAITLSIWLHSWHEHTLERQTERKFLLGLRADLREDLREQGSDSVSFVTQRRGFRYYRALTPQTVNQDSLNRYGWTLRNVTGLVPNNSRFEGLKSSGKLDVIENEELLAAILDHYQEQLPALITSTTLYNQYKLANLSSYLDQHLLPDRANLPAVMASVPMQNYLLKDGDIGNILANYHRVMDHSRKLLRLIEERLAE